MIEFLEWLQNTDVALWVGESATGFPVVEVFHVIALTLVFGSILVVDLRLVGLFSTTRPFSEVAHEMLKWTWVAFAVAVVTGILLFSQRAIDYYNNDEFRLKMLFLVIAGINMIVFEFLVAPTRRRGLDWDNGRPLRAARLAGICSLISWTLVIVFGRWIGFTIQGFNAPVATLEMDDDFMSLIGGMGGAGLPF